MQVGLVLHTKYRLCLRCSIVTLDQEKITVWMDEEDKDEFGTNGLTVS